MYRGAKSTAWEGGVRVPGFIRAPKVRQQSISGLSFFQSIGARYGRVDLCTSTQRAASLPWPLLVVASIHQRSNTFHPHNHPQRQQRFNFRPQDFHGLVHVADWLPTFLSMAGAKRTCVRPFIVSS